MEVSDPHGDVALYKLVHQWLTLPRKDEVTNRRCESRQAFRTTQWIAPGHSSEIPPWNAFIEVPCHDLTAGGFSFLLSAPPAFQQLVVALGTPPDCICLAAEVTRCTRVRAHGNGQVERSRGRGPAASDDRSLVLVGCRFVERLEGIVTRETGEHSPGNAVAEAQCHTP